MILRDPGPLILYANGHVRVGHGHRHLDPAALRRKLDRIAEQVVQHLLELSWIEGQGRQRLRGGQKVDGYVLRRRQRTVECDGVLHQRDQIGGFAGQFQTAGFDRADIQQVLHQSQHEPARALDGGHELALFGGEDRLRLQKFRVVENHAQRTAQIVRRHSDKSVLLLIQALEFGVFAGHLPLQIGQFVVEPGQFVVVATAALGRRPCAQTDFLERGPQRVGLLVVDKHQLLVDSRQSRPRRGDDDEKSIVDGRPCKMHGGEGPVDFHRHLPVERRAAGLELMEESPGLFPGRRIEQRGHRRADARARVRPQIVTQHAHDAALAIAEHHAATVVGG